MHVRLINRVYPMSDNDSFVVCVGNTGIWVLCCIHVCFGGSLFWYLLLDVSQCKFKYECEEERISSAAQHFSKLQNNKHAHIKEKVCTKQPETPSSGNTNIHLRVHCSHTQKHSVALIDITVSTVFVDVMWKQQGRQFSRQATKVPLTTWQTTLPNILLQIYTFCMLIPISIEYRLQIGSRKLRL